MKTMNFSEQHKNQLRKFELIELALSNILTELKKKIINETIRKDGVKNSN